MSGRQIVVETGLDERAGGTLVEGRVVPRTRHARTRFVEAMPPSIEPVPADRWTPPLVAARLQRMAEIFAGGPGGIRPDAFETCMPTPLLEPGKDYRPETTMPRARLTAAQINFAETTFEIVLRLFVADETAGAVIWCIANRKSFSDCADELNRMLKRRDITRFDVRNKWADQIGPAIAELFTALRVPIDAEDVTRAESRSFHRKI
ncbi:hypothetical protein [Reyranella sp.]|uniref:hypothetical protein n=1 Tax=Reyranella sp. TaxID=1929291 RepID=UPI003D137163